MTYEIYNNDCIDQMQKMEDESVGFSIFSPPFAELYVYSDDIRDMGNSLNYQQFFEHFKYLIPEIKRVLKKGRLVCLHCCDLPIMKGKEGFIGLRDFSGMLIKAFTELGFIYHTRVTIWKDPVVEMQRTKALGLLHKQIKKDASFSRVGIPDYLLVFRNEGDIETPITHQVTDPAAENYLPVDLWQKYASPVWMDINYSNTLQKRSARAEKDEKHICPLQLDTIHRALHLWSNEGDTVLSPFAGIGSEGYESLKLNRNFVGIELKESYFNQMEKNLKKVVESKSQQSLFV